MNSHEAGLKHNVCPVHTITMIESVVNTNLVVAV